ncbi:MAG: hypothetical protein ACJA0M_002540 [Chitinophagales bacterium]|jgi:hypothetical protein
MTEMELFTQANQTAQFMVSASASPSTHISIFLTIVTGYIIIAYLIGTKLTKAQVTIAIAICIVAYAFSAFMLTAVVSGMRAGSAKLALINPTAPTIFEELWNSTPMGLAILITGLLAPLWFMWPARRRKEHKLSPQQTKSNVPVQESK